MVRVVSFKIPEDLLERLDAFARKCGVTRTDVIRAAIVELLKTNPPPKISIRVRRVVIA